MNIRKNMQLVSVFFLLLVFFTGCETTNSAKSGTYNLPEGPVRSLDKVIVCYRLTGNLDDIGVKFDLSGKEILINHDTEKVADRLIVLDLQPGVFSLIGFKRGMSKTALFPTVSHSKLVPGTVYYAGDINLNYDKKSQTIFVTVEAESETAWDTLKDVYGGLIDQYQFQSLPIDAVNQKRINLKSTGSNPQMLNFYY